MQRVDYNTAEGFLFTDQYQLTMAQLYYRQGLHEKVALFDYFFREYPDYGIHKAGYCINAGLEWLLDWMLQARCRAEDIDYLRSQTGPSGQRIFHDDFLRWLHDVGTFSGLSLRAIPEGRVIHPHETLAVVQGPLALAQILETSFLNHLNYQTLIATKAARIHEIAGSRPVLEFGARRGPDKASNAGARAALIGGANFTSNVGISHILGYPPKGTHAHSMVQVFLSLGYTELDAFRAFADVYPDNCILVVDTINTLESGIPNAIKVFEELRRRGHRPAGVRLDSGDLAYLSIQAAKMLNEAGFNDAAIVLSNELDELTIWQIQSQIQEEGPRNGIDPSDLINRLIYGVGTRLINSAGAPSLGGVYKLVAVEDQGRWLPAIKISETMEKTPNPGNKQVWRVYDQRQKATADLVCLQEENPQILNKLTLRHPLDAAKRRVLDRQTVTLIEPLLVEVLNHGKLIYELPTIEDIRKKRQADMDRLDAGVRRLMNPHIYHVSLSEQLWKLKQKLIQSAVNSNNK